MQPYSNCGLYAKKYNLSVQFLLTSAGISQYHFYWLPPKEGSPTFFRPPACRSLPVPEYISKSFLRLHSLLSKHSILAPRNACLPILSGTPAACQKASAYSSLSDMTWIPIRLSSAVLQHTYEYDLCIPAHQLDPPVSSHTASWWLQPNLFWFLHTLSFFYTSA